MKSGGSGGEAGVLKDNGRHVTFYISSLSKGGSERVLVNLAEYFYGRGYRVTVVTQYRAEKEYEVSEGIGRVLSDLTQKEEGKGRAANFCRRFSKLRGVWKELRPDIIVSFIGKNNMMALLTSRFLHIPVVVCVRGEPKEEYYSRFLRLAARTLFYMADGVVLQTAESLRFFPEAVRGKSILLKNSLNPTFLRTPWEGEREKKIVAVGRIDANKNHEMLIRAFAAMADRYPEYVLAIYGEGELRPRLIKLSEELGLKNRVLLPGAVTEVADAIYKASVFVLCSWSEGIPNTLLEAMALGLPVISTDCSGGGAAELITQGENGLLVQPGNWKEMEENLQKLLDNPDYARKIGHEAAKIQEKYNPDIINGVWENYLKEKMNGRKR